MQAVAGAVQAGPPTAGTINFSGQITIPPDPAATSFNLLWMVSGSAFLNPMGPVGLLSCMVTISGTGESTLSTSATWKLEYVRVSSHEALPMLMLHTQWPAGTYNVSIVGIDPNSFWDLNDTMQVAVVELDHTGIGGGQ